MLKGGLAVVCYCAVLTLLEDPEWKLIKELGKQTFNHMLHLSKWSLGKNLVFCILFFVGMFLFGGKNSFHRVRHPQNLQPCFKMLEYKS